MLKVKRIEIYYYSPQAEWLFKLLCICEARYHSVRMLIDQLTYWIPNLQRSKEACRGYKYYSFTCPDKGRVQIVLSNDCARCKYIHSTLLPHYENAFGFHDKLCAEIHTYHRPDSVSKELLITDSFFEWTPRPEWKAKEWKFYLFKGILLEDVQ